jgi:hypothetical protein
MTIGEEMKAKLLLASMVMIITIISCASIKDSENQTNGDNENPKRIDDTYVFDPTAYVQKYEAFKNKYYNEVKDILLIKTKSDIGKLQKYELKDITAELIRKPNSANVISYDIVYHLAKSNGDEVLFNESYIQSIDNNNSRLTGDSFGDKFKETEKYTVDFKVEKKPVFSGKSKNYFIEGDIANISVMSNELFGKELVLKFTIFTKAVPEGGDYSILVSVVSKISGYFSFPNFTNIDYDEVNLLGAGNEEGEYPTGMAVSVILYGSSVDRFTRSLESWKAVAKFGTANTASKAILKEFSAFFDILGEEITVYPNIQENTTITINDL